MKKKIVSVLLIGILISLPVLLSGCKTITTLNRIGPALVSLGDGFNTELALLRDAGLLTTAKYDEIVKLDIGGRARVIGTYLTNLKAITSTNKAEIVAEIGKAVAEIGKAVAAFQALPNLVPPDSIAAKVLTAIAITLQSASIAIGFVQPPATVQGMRGPQPGISTAVVKVKLEGIPKEAMKYIAK